MRKKDRYLIKSLKEHTIYHTVATHTFNANLSHTPTRALHKFQTVTISSYADHNNFFLTFLKKNNDSYITIAQISNLTNKPSC